VPETRRRRLSRPLVLLATVAASSLLVAPTAAHAINDTGSKSSKVENKQRLKTGSKPKNQRWLGRAKSPMESQVRAMGSAGYGRVERYRDAVKGVAKLPSDSGIIVAIPRYDGAGYDYARFTPMNRSGGYSNLRTSYPGVVRQPMAPKSGSGSGVLSPQDLQPSGGPDFFDARDSRLQSHSIGGWARNPYVGSQVVQITTQ
jgi:hypothetical protein